jgi:hypothetical protein
MHLARDYFAEYQWAKTTYHLERAHIVGQRYFFGHLITHVWVLRMAWVRRDFREAVGQFIRILTVLLGFFSAGCPWVTPVGLRFRPSCLCPFYKTCKSALLATVCAVRFCGVCRSTSRYFWWRGGCLRLGK